MGGNLIFKKIENPQIEQYGYSIYYCHLNKQKHKLDISIPKICMFVMKDDIIVYVPERSQKSDFDMVQKCYNFINKNIGKAII